jgi:OHS family lactose permease-like MFS transporter
MATRTSQFRFLCGFVYTYFFAQAMSISLLAVWLGQTLKLSGTEAGFVFAANAFAAMCSQPIYGFVSDRVGTRRNILWTVAALVALSGLFFPYLYAPLLRRTSCWAPPWAGCTSASRSLPAAMRSNRTSTASAAATASNTAA